MVQLKQQFQGYESVENSNKDKKPCFEVEAVEVEGARFIQDESRLRHLIITYKPANFDAGTFMNWWNRRLVKEAHDGPFHMVALDVLFYNGEELHAFAVQLEMESYAPQVINVFNRLGDE
ncbi:uncharacterized protein KY384_000110 [Bacidia gigantensis]|uniref:uncharacterized protein n=1 Tax=Bacidia gigantensis TaxID=2732470 RepID=UPI001D04F7D3|nr:uncharacterized protein KY384_000110 [Bacidia gigantensis]KAG8526117.1 hypothetical protein KY384_000110 [Bacidia gigantensis]